MWAGERTGNHSHRETRGRERKDYNRDRIESPPEKMPFSFCLLHDFLT